MTKGLVSVILPIYNVETYLDYCIESVISQTYSNLEIILVDDGSPDNCPQICDEWAKKDNRIKVIHKQNAGLGMARNTGIDHATGEYICFFDSDDCVAQNIIEQAYTVAQRTKADIVTYGYRNMDQDGKLKKSFIPKTTKQVYEGEEVQEDFLLDLITDDINTVKSSNLTMSAWASFYSMELIRRTGWRFVSEREIISEDVYSILLLYKDIKKVVVISNALYYYRENPSSLSRSYSKERFTRICYFHEKCMEIEKQLGYNEEVAMRIAYVFLGFTIGTMKMLVLAEKEKREKRLEFKAIIDNQHLQMVLSKLDWKKVKIRKKILFYSMRMKWYRICYGLVKIKVGISF